MDYLCKIHRDLCKESYIKRGREKTLLSNIFFKLLYVYDLF